MKQQFYILSACLPYLDNIDNHLRTCQLKRDLAGTASLRVKSCYKDTSEDSFLVVTEDQSMILALADKYNQESVLVREPSNAVSLLFSSGQSEYIGEWKQVPQWVAEDNGSYTKYGDNWFIAVKYT